MKKEKLSNKQCIEVLKKYYYFDNNKKNKEIKINLHTDDGVNYFFALNRDNVYESFRDYVNSFDVDYEVDLLRESKDYRASRSIINSYNDINDYKCELLDCLAEMECREVFDRTVDIERIKRELESIDAYNLKDILITCFLENFDKQYITLKTILAYETEREDNEIDRLFEDYIKIDTMKLFNEHFYSDEEESY